MGEQGVNWRPAEELVSFNKALVQLETEYLGVLRRARPLAEWLHSPLFREIWTQIDGNPRQALLMARIKTSHAMTPHHGVNVMLCARAWAVNSHKLGLRLDDFSIAALLHDLGHWRPETLVFAFDYFTRAEWALIQRHPQPESEDFACLNAELKRWIAEHHEQPDGKGYPTGMTDPHHLSQMLRIVDCFEGLTTERRIRRAYSQADALALMAQWAGHKFAAGLFRNFVNFVGHFPLGSFYRHKDGSLLCSLGNQDEHYAFLRVSNQQGDPLEAGEPLLFSMAEIAEHHEAWREPDLPDAWQNLRPDLLGLPRSY